MGKKLTNKDPKKAKIIHIITKLELGGAQQTTLYTIANMDQSRYIPILICGNGGILIPEARQIPGVKVYICDELIRPIAPLQDLRALIRLRRILLKERLSHDGPILVHTHSSKAGILGRCAACLAGIPIRIHTVHGFGFNPYQPFLLKWALILAEIMSGFFTTKTIYVSRDNLEQGIRLGISTPKDSCIIRSGIHWDIFSRPLSDRAYIRKGFGEIPEDAKVVGMIACFKPQKAPLDFIRMAYLVSLKVPGTYFLLIGDGVLRHQIEKLIKDLGICENVLLAGWRKDIPEMIHAMDIMVLASLWEGLPKVVVEAQLMGVPVVATNTSGVAEVVQDGVSGFLTPPGRPDVMAQKVIGLLKDHKAMAAMGRKARAVSREFDLKQVMEKQDRLYLQCIASRSGINQLLN